jgi:dTDP-4-dehydrorhamnose 3,5-epimerase
MKFVETQLKGAYIIDLDKKEDERGFFARAFCRDEYLKYDLSTNIVQINNSFSNKKGTLRGMHFQITPKSEDKIIRCIKGAIYDVIIDLRPTSKTFCKWFGTELNEENRKTLYVPKGFAHGNVSLIDNSELIYLVTEYYSSEHERGIRWDDPFFKLEWPVTPAEISEKDKNHRNFNKEEYLRQLGKNEYPTF